MQNLSHAFHNEALTLSPTDTASMHNGRRPFMPNAAGQSPYLSTGTHQAPLFTFKLYTQTYRHSDAKKAHTKRPSPPQV